MELWKKTLLLFIIFVCGGSLMIFEMAGPRLLSPYMGSSIYIWTSMIGVVMIGLWIGYRFGGFLADSIPKWEVLGFVVSIAALFIVLSTPFALRVVEKVAHNIFTVKLSSFVASVILFGPIGFLLGIVSPFAVRVSLKNAADAGNISGTYYAISTTGSVVGTFLAGFFLLPLLGSISLLYLVSILLSVASLLLFLFFTKKRIVSLFPLLLLVFAIWKMLVPVENPLILLDKDTRYSRVVVYDTPDPWGGDKIVRFFMINNEHSGAVYTECDSIVNDYLKFYDLSDHFFPNPKKAMMIGASACVYPRRFLERHPNSTIDVVEIDQEQTAIAKQFFRLKDDKRMNFIYQDARTFLNNSDKKYDVIYGDAFRSMFAAPYQLTTYESTVKLYNMLNPNGVILVNIISNLDMSRNDFLKAEIRTFLAVFPKVLLFAVQGTEDRNRMQNFLIVGLKNSNPVSLLSDNDYLKNMLKNLVVEEIDLSVPVLTDDFAPVEYYADKLIY